MGRAAVVRACLLLFACLASAASAHQGGTTGYAAIALNGNALRYQLNLSQWPSAFLAAQGGNAESARAGLPEALASSLHFSNAGAACAVASARVEPATLGKEGVAAVLDVVCREAVTTLVLKDDSFDRLGADVHTLARIDWPGGSSQFAFASESRVASVVIAERPAPVQGFASFADLGFWHILGGYDHLLFLLALLLAPATGWTVVR